MPKFALVPGRGPLKRRPADPLPDDPLARAKARYITSRITLRALVEEFKGEPGCSWSTLTTLAAREEWSDEREKYRDAVVTKTVDAMGLDDAERNKRHLVSARNTITTLDKILQGIHEEVVRILQLQVDRKITAAQAVGLLRACSSAAKNVSLGQGFSITLEQKLATSEGSAFQRLSDAAETAYSDVVARRQELVKRAELAAHELEKQGARGRAGRGSK